MAVKIWFVVILSLLIFSFILKHNKQGIDLSGDQFVLKNKLSMKLIIPKLNIDTKVQLVGITEDGNMDVPNSLDEVGLFKLGPKPGEVGSAVIAGHFDDKNGNQAVFYNLNKLVKGDEIFVKDRNDKTTIFVVREVRKFDEKYAEEVFSTNDMAHLNLITCNGIWNKTRKSYDSRLVVFTDIKI